MLIEDNAEVNVKIHSTSRRSFRTCKCCESVASERCDVNAVNEIKWTPLHLAAQQGHVDVAKCWLRTVPTCWDSRMDGPSRLIVKCLATTTVHGCWRGNHQRRRDWVTWTDRKQIERFRNGNPVGTSLMSRGCCGILDLSWQQTRTDSFVVTFHGIFDLDRPWWGKYMEERSWWRLGRECFCDLIAHEWKLRKPKPNAVRFARFTLFHNTPN